MNENEFENVTPEVDEEVKAFENVEEQVAEEISEVAEEIAEEVNEVVEEVTEEIDETNEVVEETAEEFKENAAEEVDAAVEEIIEKKKSKTPAIIAIVAVVILALAAYVLYDSFGGNKYNKLGYANPYGRTVADVCEELGISIDEFKTNYKLPEDMTEDTEEMAAYYSIPVGVFAQMYGVDYATFKETYKIPEETTPSKPTTVVGKIKALFGVYDIQPIDENTPWGIVMGELTLANYVGEQNLDTFKEYYGITDESVTAETKYKDIRKLVEEKEMERAKEAEHIEDQAETEGTENADEVATDDTVDAEVQTTEE